MNKNLPIKNFRKLAPLLALILGAICLFLVIFCCRFLICQKVLL